MSHRGAEEMLLTFQDVVACFSQKECELFHNWQTALHENVMKEIYQVLMSLGPLIATCVFSLKSNQKEDLHSVDDENSERRHSDNHSPSVSVSALDMFNVNRNDTNCPEDPQNIGRRKSPRPLVTHRNESSDMLSNRPQGDPVVGFGTKQSFTDDNKRLFQPETADVQVNTEISVITCLISSDIKEETETSFVDQQIEGSISNVGDPFVTSGTSQSFTDDRKEFLQQTTEDEHGRISESFGTGHWLRGQKSERRHLFGNESNMCSSKKHQKVIRSEQHLTGSEFKKRLNNEALLVENPSTHPEWETFPFTTNENSSTGMPSLVWDQRLHTGRRHFYCTVCSKSFSREASLVMHQRVHTGDRPYPCTECDKSFTQKGNLLRHQRVHTGVKPFHCTECEKSFALKAHLVRHQTTHTGEKPYKCEKHVTRKKNLVTH